MKVMKKLFSVIIFSFVFILLSCDEYVDDNKDSEYIPKVYNVKYCGLKCKNYTIRGNYYKPEIDTGKPLLLLLHGTAHGKWMWDVPDDVVSGYSWVDFFTKRYGFPILAIDRIGVGDSSKPPGDVITFAFEAIVLKKMIKKVSEEEGRPIVLIGHSSGGALGNAIAGSDGNVIDGVVTIGWLHGLERLDMNIKWAEAFIKGILNGFDYISVSQDFLTEYCFYPDNYEKTLLNYFIENVEPFPRGGSLIMFDPDICSIGAIDIPVFLTAGEYDASQVKVDLEKEANRFKYAYSKDLVSTFLQENAGHSCMYHKNYHLLLDAILDWLEFWYD